jgi:Domain of unknown function (DUF3482)/50S ribosome-binding GTPase
MSQTAAETKPWVNPEIPAFAVVGRVNMGKSAVLATLLEIDDNELLRVSPTPGETTRCQIHRLVFANREFARFIDTPGFSQPVEAMREIQRIHGEGTPGLDAVRRFIHLNDGRFADEKRLLEPLADGAGVLYVIDPAKPLRDDFLAEMEILRWTGRPRLALMNRRENHTGPDEEAWKTRLGGAFNLTRTFDAHHARYEERIRLLKALLEIEELHRPALEETIRAVEDEWDIRREEAAEAIITFLEDALGLRASANLDEKDMSLPARRQRHTDTLTRKYFDDLAALERRCATELLRIHRHHLLKADADSSIDPGVDLESGETWKKWGLGRSQLALAAAIAGGAAGLAVDAATGGLTHGAGTLVGALSGGAAAWFKGARLPDLRIDLRGGIKLGSGETRSLVIGPPRNPNFPWILLDGALVRYQKILARSHGRRDEARLTGTGSGFTRDFPSARRNLLAKWFGGCLKLAPDRSLEPEVFTAIVESLADVK